MTNHYYLLVVFHFCRSVNDIEEKRKNIKPNKSYGPLNVVSRTSASPPPPVFSQKWYLQLKSLYNGKATKKST